MLFIMKWVTFCEDLIEFQLSGIILGIGSASDRSYIVTPSFIVWAHTQNGPWLATEFLYTQ